MNKLPRISVALCTYFGEAFLAEQLKSIQQQTISVDEIIICDDCSQDKTHQIIEIYKAAGLPIQLHINPKRLGFIQNFAKATSLCSGDIIFLCDQDDIWQPHKVAVMRKPFMDDTEVMLTFSDAQLIDQNGTPLIHTLWECVNLSPTSQVDFLDLLNHTRITGAATAFRKSLLEVALPILPGWIHDAWFGIVAASIGKVYPIPEKLIFYRQHTHNQIGIRKPTWKNLLEKTLRLATQSHTEHADQYIPLVERFDAYPDVKHHLQQKMQHLESRQPANGKFLPILSGIVKEMLNLRYFRYAYGWNSIFRDLMLLGWQTVHRTPPASGTK